MKKLFYVTRLGIEFRWKGDAVIWVWPWKRPSFREKFISLSFTGYGDDAYFTSLKKLDEMWDDYFEAEQDEGQPVEIY